MLLMTRKGNKTMPGNPSYNIFAAAQRALRHTHSTIQCSREKTKQIRKDRCAATGFALKDENEYFNGTPRSSSWHFLQQSMI
jgi:predicted RNA methylase